MIEETGGRKQKAHEEGKVSAWRQRGKKMRCLQKSCLRAEGTCFSVAHERSVRSLKNMSAKRMS